MTDEAQGTLISEPESNGIAPDALPTIQLPSARHYKLLRHAVIDRISTIKKLAEKNEGESYGAAAREQHADELALKEDVLPQLTQELDLPLTTVAELESAIKNMFRGVVRIHAKDDDEEDSPGFVDHRAELLKEIGERVARFVLDVAGRAYAAGKITREHEPEALAMKSIEQLAST